MLNISIDRRRTFLYGASALLLGCINPRRSTALNECFPAPSPTGTACRAGLQPPQLITAYEAQENSMWCWAASLSMLFRHYGYMISQERIVDEALGEVWNVPATGLMISQQLSRSWVDDRNNHFLSSVAGVYDFYVGILAINDLIIINSLMYEKPLIIGNWSHAMLLVAVNYIPYPHTPSIVWAEFMDPWPGAGRRAVQHPSEIVPAHLGGNMRYLVIPSITPL